MTSGKRLAAFRLVTRPLVTKESEMTRTAIVLHPKDDVATALRDLRKGDTVVVELNGRPLEVILRDDIPFGHKLALRNIARGEPILKYGLPILKAREDISTGQWVHTHNSRSDRWAPENETFGVLTERPGVSPKERS
jgi:altronate dehydratase small subunit